MTVLDWIDDATGYQCPNCGLFVAIPRRYEAHCPRCPDLKIAPQPLVERLQAALEAAGLDESDAATATRVTLAVLADD